MLKENHQDEEYDNTKDQELFGFTAHLHVHVFKLISNAHLTFRGDPCQTRTPPHPIPCDTTAL